METLIKKERIKPTPEMLFNVYIETSHAGAPVKDILQRYGLKPWDLAIIRKKIKEAALEALSKNGKRGVKKQLVPLEEYRRMSRQWEETKEALATIGYELTLLKKRTNSV